MGAPRSNQFWKARKKHGTNPIYGGDGAELWKDACEYFEWCDNNPWERVELVKYQGDATEHNIPLGRPYSMDGLTIFIGVSGSYFRTRKTALKELAETNRMDEDEESFLQVIERIEMVVKTQQVEGAVVGVFNASLVARMNGISDTINNVNTGDSVLKVVVRDQKTADNLNALDDQL